MATSNFEDVDLVEAEVVDQHVFVARGDRGAVGVRDLLRVVFRGRELDVVDYLAELAVGADLKGLRAAVAVVGGEDTGTGMVDADVDAATTTGRDLVDEGHGAGFIVEEPN